MSLVSHLIRRGLDASPLEENAPKCEVPPAWQALGSLSTFFAILFVFLFEYVFYSVFATLCMVEQPTYTTVPLSGDQGASLLPEGEDGNVDQEAIVLHKPITSSLRETSRHLTRVGGRLSHFRGFGLYIVYSTLTGLVAGLVAAILPLPKGMHLVVSALAAVVASLVMARWMMAWTWVVISEPSPLRWWRRIPPLKTWTKVMPATAVFALAQQLTAFIPLIIFDRTGLGQRATNVMQSGDSKTAWTLTWQLGLVMLAYAVAAAIILVPAHLVLVRVHASMLPEETEAIVPLDRSFGGKVVPEVVGGKGCLELSDAIKSVDYPSWIRLIKMYVKIVILHLTLTVALAAIVGVQFAVTMKCAEFPKDGEIHD